jgi:hypothetical protein
MRFPLVAVAITTLALLAPTESAADDFSARIKAGTSQSLDGLFFNGTLAISGTQGFALNVTHESGPLLTCTPCEPGETVSLTGVVGAGALGTAVFRGKTYVFDGNTGSVAIWLESGSFTLPAGTGTEPTFVEFEAPFTVVSDRSVVTLQTGANGEILHTLTLSGSGTATLQLMVTYHPELETHLYWYQSIRYDFSKKKPKSNE